jgi:integrase
MTRLTARFLENVKPADVRREIPDSGCRALYLIVQPTGRKAWAVRYRYQGKTRKLTLDNIGSLADARRAATAALHELERGKDPAALKFDARAQAEAAAADRARDTIDALVHRFLEQYARRRTRRNSWKQAEHVFFKIALPAWQGRIIHDIARRDVRELLEHVAETRPTLANRAHAHLSKFFNWCLEQDIIAVSPAHGVKPPAEEQARDRVLTDAEVVALWHACDAIGGSAGAAVKLLILTGQRCGEVVGMRRGEISGDVWTLPPERTKNKQRHEVPLSAQALAMIEAIPGVDRDFLFTSSETRRLGNMAQAKVTLDMHMKPAQAWVIHDIRRTVATGLAKLGIDLPVIEKVLNHKGGSFAGVVGIYQRHKYAAEKREALQRWANHVVGLVTGKVAEDKVVSIAGRR